MPYNTGNPIPSSDAKDLSDNAENLDNSVNTALDTWTDRLGVERRTIQGQLKLLGYTAPDVYAGGLVFTIAENMATIDRNGTIYAPKPSAIPFTTSGTWTADDEDKFFVVQGVINTSPDIIRRTKYTIDILTDTTSPDKFESDYYDANLAGNSGAAWVKDGTSGTPSTLDLDTKHIYNANGDGYLYPSESVIVTQFGAVGDKVTDDTAAIVSADKSGFIEFPVGTYLITQDHSFNSVVSMRGGILYSSFFMSFQAGFEAAPYYCLQCRLGEIKSEKKNVRWMGAQGDGQYKTPNDDGIDIESEAWNTWDNTAFKDNLPFSPYGTGGTFVPPKPQPFSNTDTWDYIGISRTMWSAEHGFANTYIPSGDFGINMDENRGRRRGITIMRGMEQVISGDGQYASRIRTSDDADFFANNNTGDSDYYSIFAFYRIQANPTTVYDISVTGPNNYTAASDNLSLFLCQNINGVYWHDCWFNVCTRVFSCDTQCGDNFVKSCVSEFAFGHFLHAVDQSFIEVDDCNLWASSTTPNQGGILSDDAVIARSTKFRGFYGTSIDADTALINGCTFISDSGANPEIKLKNGGTVSGCEFSGDAQAAYIVLEESGTISGCYFNNSSNHASIECGDGIANNARNIIITGNRFLKTNGVSENQNYSITAPENGINFTDGATESMVITNNIFSGRALQAIGSATIINNTFSGVFVP